MEQFSSNSTACSTPTVDTVEKVFKNDSVRYRRKGYGLISAISIAFSFLYFFPIFFKWAYENYLSQFSEAQLYIGLNIAVHSGIYLIANVAMYFIYITKLEFFERYRILTREWPWESNPEKWKMVLIKTLKATFLVHFILLPIALYADTLLGLKVRFDLESFPGYTEILPQLIFFMICEDFLFYWSHRTLHHPKLYPYIHKKHHEYGITVSIAAEYAHPLEWLFGNLVPTAAGAKLLGANVHIVTYVMWGIIRIMETVDGHSGYEFSWSPYRLLPLSGSSSYHNFHHYHNVGNYSSFFSVWDTICGTNKAYFRHLAKKEKEEIAAKIKQQFENMKAKQKEDNDSKLAEKIEKEGSGRKIKFADEITTNVGDISSKKEKCE